MAKRRANGEGSIYTKIRNGKTYYCATMTLGISESGEPIRKSFGSYKKSEVIEKKNKAKYEFDNQKLSKTDIKFGSLFKSWIYDFKKVEVSNNTFAEYEVCYRLRVGPYSIARLKAKDITLQDLQYYFNQLRKTWTPKTVKKTYTKINSCFNFAAIQNLVVKNYCKGVTLEKIQKKKDDEFEVFTKDEQDLILTQLDTRDLVDRMIYFTLYTGLRLGEVSAIKWSDITDNILKIQRQWQKNIYFVGSTRHMTYEFKDILKNDNSYRDVPLPNKALSILNLCPKDSELVFGIGGKGIDPKRPNRRLKRICKKLNITYRSFHALRHSYATRLFEMDVPVKTVQKLLGHSDIATTMDTYTHVMLDKKMEVLDKLNSL